MLPVLLKLKIDILVLPEGEIFDAYLTTYIPTLNAHAPAVPVSSPFMN